MKVMGIMVVDDEEDQRVLLQWLLQDWGYDVQAAANGSEAIACARRQCPDVVLMDLNMPVMNGFEATRRLRVLPRMGRAHIIAISGYLHDNPAWCDRAYAAGCDKCFGKPVDSELLHTELQRLDVARRRDDDCGNRAFRIAFAPA